MSYESVSGLLSVPTNVGLICYLVETHVVFQAEPSPGYLE